MSAWFRVGQTVTVAVHRDPRGNVRPILGEVVDVPDEYRVVVQAAYPLERGLYALTVFDSEQLSRIQREHPPVEGGGSKGEA